MYLGEDGMRESDKEAGQQMVDDFNEGRGSSIIAFEEAMNEAFKAKGWDKAFRDHFNSGADCAKEYVIKNSLHHFTQAIENGQAPEAELADDHTTETE